MVSGIIKELFINACILVTILFLSSQIFLKTGLGSKTPLRIKVLAGVMGAILAIILMFFSIKIPPHSIMDLRNTALMVVAIYAGGVAALITGVITAAFRLIYLGISSTAITSAVTTLLITMFLITIRNMKISRLRKWIYMFFISGIIPSFTFWFNIRDPIIVKEIIIFYWTGSLFAAIIAYSLTEYLNKNNLLFQNLTLESNIDYLTGLKNSRSFDEAYNIMLKSALKSNESLAVLMLDLDFFKRVNDIHGHAAGDEVLKVLANLLKQSTRNFDTVARIGGEEFCIVLSNSTKRSAFDTAERIRKKVEAHDFILPSGLVLNITISIGCAVFPETEIDVEKIKEAADMKLYEAKRSGRNRVCI